MSEYTADFEAAETARKNTHIMQKNEDFNPKMVMTKV